MVTENHRLTLKGPKTSGGRLPPAVVGSVLYPVAGPLAAMTGGDPG